MATLVNFSDFIKFPLKCFKAFGSVPYGGDGENVTWKKKCLKFYHYYLMANLIVATAFIAVFVKKNHRNLSMITEAVPVYGYALMAMVKTISIYFKREELKDIIETSTELFPKTKEEQNIFKVRKYYTNYNRMERIFSKIIFLAAMDFVAIKLGKFVMTGIWYDKLPFDNWFPFDPYNPMIYNFVVLWQTQNTFVAISSLCGSDLMLYSFITLMTMQFDILSQQVEKLTPKDDDKKIGELVERHETLLRLSRNLESIYAISILFNFVASSILICLVGFQVSIGISFELFVKFSMLLFAAAIQVLLLCYYGNKLTTAAENVAISAYNSEWFGTNDNKKLKVALILMIQRAQKPTVITAYKFGAVTLQTYTTVLSWSYSYFTLLQSLNGDTN